jgi:carboxyl-terminal processing protease
MASLRTSFRVLLIFALGTVAGAGLSLGPSVNAERDIPPPAPGTETLSWRDARLFAEVLERIRQDYVDRVPDGELMKAAVRGLIGNLDQHSAFLDPHEFADMRINTTGEYSGVGIELALDNGTVKVVKPMDGGPAARAGIRTGDRILAVDEVQVNGQDLDDAIDRLRGKSGSGVRVSIARGVAGVPLLFTLQRETVQVHSVRSSMLKPGFGYLRITNFSTSTAVDVDTALVQLQEQSGGLRGLVLDLRNNPGGILEAAIGVSDEFLESGVIVSADGRARDAKFEMQAQAGDVLEGAPLAVLINGGSASASEIVAGALKDHQRATLIGSKTYGKGSVQTVIPLSDGYAMKLTTSRYFTPSGVSIHETGIEPDVAVAAPANGQPRLAVEVAHYGNLAHDFELQLALETLQQGEPASPTR